MIKLNYKIAIVWKLYQTYYGKGVKNMGCGTCKPKKSKCGTSKSAEKKKPKKSK